MKLSDIPKELLHIILSYDGRIKYKKGKYVNIIHKNDERYNILSPIISKKLKIMQNIELSNRAFYFEFAFEKQPKIILCYDYNWSYNNTFEICYTDMKESGHVLGSNQIRTIYA